MASRRLALTALLVPDYDEALGFFVDVLRFSVLEDTRLSDDKRWVRVAPSTDGGALLLARAASPEQASLIGRQGAGRVFLFVHTDDFDGDLARLRAHGCAVEPPRVEPYGRVAVFTDPWGNRWDLLEPRDEGPAP